jgi:alkanesulfonate monooxygenase SsuD/methylene tetrahydromethanopterin reductase-like flavin-dependent oxidoreductase (luciferase family)
MDVGVCLPYMKQGLDRATLLGFARAVEAGPFASLSCGERITGPTVDLGLAMAAASAVTSRVRIVPTLYVLPLHDAVKAAKEIATLDVLSGGRAAVTVGVGGRPLDYRAVSAPFDAAMRAWTSRWRACVGLARRTARGADPIGPRPAGRRTAIAPV